MPKEINTYTAYTLEQYLEDADFRAWVLHPTAEEDEAWEAVWVALPDQAPIAAKAKELLLAMEQQFWPDVLKKREVDEAFIQELQLRMQKQRALLQRQQRNVYLQRWAIAASVVVLLCVVSGLLILNPFSSMREIATRYGEWKTLTLPDGSEVHLNANSNLRYARNWKEGEDRKVWLEGEAFFQVSKDGKGTKFTVLTDDLGVEVLGTSFNVNSRGEETEVFLEEGKVRLDLGEEEKIMEPGELVAYSAPQKKITDYRKIANETYTSWKDGSMVIKDESVAEIFRKMEQLYGYEFEVQDEALLDKVKTVAIPMDRIEVAIPILERVLGVEITQKGRQLIVK